MTAANARDVGFFIRDMIEGRHMHLYREDDEGDLTDIGDDAYINHVDVSDPENMIIVLDNNETFNVVITRRG
jgi:hypothetical protein